MKKKCNGSCEVCDCTNCGREINTMQNNTWLVASACRHHYVQTGLVGEVYCFAMAGIKQYKILIKYK